MLLLNLWENQTAAARMSFKYVSLSAGDNGPVYQSANELHKQPPQHTHKHKHINGVTSEAPLRGTSGWLKCLKSRKQSPGKTTLQPSKACCCFTENPLSQDMKTIRSDLTNLTMSWNYRLSVFSGIYWGTRYVCNAGCLSLLEIGQTSA